MTAIAALPAEQQVEAVLQLLVKVLGEMSVEAVRQRRTQLMEHFSNCGGSYETCVTILEMVDRYIAIREKWTAERQAEVRPAPQSDATSQMSRSLLRFPAGEDRHKPHHA